MPSSLSSSSSSGPPPSSDGSSPGSSSLSSSGSPSGSGSASGSGSGSGSDSDSASGSGSDSGSASNSDSGSWSSNGGSVSLSSNYQSSQQSQPSGGSSGPSPSSGSGSESGSSECGDAQEQQWWDDVKGIAVPMITFWVGWLREDGQNPCPSKLTCIIRAISWVESRHGHGSGNYPARDPMQVGNPGDTAWENIGKNPSDDQWERPVRQGSLTGCSWKDIPGVIKSDPNLPPNVDPTLLPADGHRNAQFTKNMSYLWGVIWYFYSLQQVMPVGERGAWRLGNCDPAFLIDGAVKYNGESNPDYRQEITDALSLICCSSEFNL